MINKGDYVRLKNLDGIFKVNSIAEVQVGTHDGKSLQGKVFYVANIHTKDITQAMAGEVERLLIQKDDILYSTHDGTFHTVSGYNIEVNNTLHVRFSTGETSTYRAVERSVILGDMHFTSIKHWLR